MEVQNTVTGQVGRVVGFWINVAGNVVVNVRVGGMAASWLSGKVAVL